MTTTNLAFIRAYHRDATVNDVRGYGAVDDRPSVAEYYAPTQTRYDWRTSVQVVGPETRVDVPQDQPANAPAQPVFPSSLRHQQQYFRLDQAAVGQNAIGSAAPTEFVPHFAPPPHEPAQPHADFRRGGYSSSWGGAELEPRSTLAVFQYPALCQRLLESWPAAYDGVVDLIASMAEEGRSLIGVAGCTPYAGCTTTVLSAALRLRSEGRSVTVVDANFTRPALANSLGIHAVTTWQDVLVRGAPLASALVRSAGDGLVVLPSAHAMLPTTSYRQSSMTAGALRYQYDVTLLDLGAVLEAHQSEIALTLAQAMRIDGVLLVADADRVDAMERRHAERLFLDSHCPVLGLVENFAAVG